MAGPQIDRDKLRDAVRKLGDEYVFYMLDDAIELLPEGKLWSSGTSISRSSNRTARPRKFCFRT